MLSQDPLPDKSSERGCLMLSLFLVALVVLLVLLGTGVLIDWLQNT